LKVDGERSNGRLGATRTEALWNHAIATYWGLQTGVRQDFGDGPGRTWASFGVQGLSPYWFDVQATAYVGEGGRTALRLETEYDLLITQRLILQPDVKFDVYGRDDTRREIGAGLSQIEAGLRLRYEVTRKVAPYVGVVWNRKFGNTARLARQSDTPVQQIEAVAGVHFWF
jgi:copper resistance protein B